MDGAATADQAVSRERVSIGAPAPLATRDARVVTSSSRPRCGSSPAGATGDQQEPAAGALQFLPEPAGHPRAQVGLVAQTVVLTRTSARSTPMPPGESLAGYAATGATLVLHLAVQRMDQLAPELAAHYGPDCPVAVVARASRDDELVLRGTLADIAQQVSDAGVRRTAVVIVGPVVHASVTGL